MIKKIILGAVILVIITIAIIFIIPWGNYESDLVKSDLDETVEVIDSSGNIIASLESLEGIYKVENIEGQVAELLFEIDGMKNTIGAFERFSVTFDIVDDYQNSSIDLIIESNSINTANKTRDEALISDEFFDVIKYPTIEFHSDKIDFIDSVYYAKGNLTLMKSTKELTIPLKHLGSGISDTGIEFEAFEGEFEFDRTIYGMIEEGGIGNIVTISFYCEMSKSEE